jgi:hypothetical protein
VLLFWSLSEFYWAPRSRSYISFPVTWRRLERLVVVLVAPTAGRYGNPLGIGWRATSLAPFLPAGMAAVIERGAMGTAGQKPEIHDAAAGSP